MEIIVVLLALALERFLDLQKTVKRFNWFDAYIDCGLKYLKPYGAIAVLATLSLVLAIVIWLIDVIFGGLIDGDISLLLQFLVLFYCLGPENILQTFERFVKARQKGEESSGRDQEMRNQFYVQMNVKVTGLIFWFVILGVFGAIVYRSLDLMKQNADKDGALSDYKANLAQWMGIADWVPARIIGFIYTICGRFKESFSAYMKLFLKGLDQNEALLESTGIAALKYGQATEDKESQLGLVEAKKHMDIVLIVYAVIVLVVLLIA